jgi:PAS domain S-box-containing protein
MGEWQGKKPDSPEGKPRMTDHSTFPAEEVTSAEAKEQQRLATLRALGILDTEPEERFDRLMRLAARHFRVPIALVSLVDERRCWLKSITGLALVQVERATSFCNHAINGNGVFVVEDAKADPRFQDNPLVIGEPYIRHYGGYPLHALSGEIIGFFCVVDTEPRQMAPEDMASLADFAHLVEQELNSVQVQLDDRTHIASLRQEVGVLETDLIAKAEDIKIGVKQNARLLIERQTEKRRADALTTAVEHQRDARYEGVFSVDGEGRITFVSPNAAALTGHTPEALLGSGWHAVLRPADANGRPFAADECPLMATLADGRGRHIVGMRLGHRDGSDFPAICSTTPIVGGSQQVGVICSFTTLAT